MTMMTKNSYNGEKMDIKDRVINRNISIKLRKKKKERFKHKVHDTHKMKEKMLNDDFILRCENKYTTS